MDEQIARGNGARRITAFGGSHWSERRDYEEWLSGCILRRLQIAGTDIAADFDCGIGRYAGPMALYASAVVGVDRSAAILNKIRGHSWLTLVQASVEDVASGQVRLPHDGYDVMLLRRSRQHVSDPAQMIAGLAGLLRPSGRMLVVMLPATPTYPLFTAALDLFPQLHAGPAGVASAMRAAGLRAELSYERYPLLFSTRKWMRMVRDRFMPFLSHFDDDQIDAGIAEIRQAHPGDGIAFTDTLAFILGTAP